MHTNTRVTSECCVDPFPQVDGERAKNNKALQTTAVSADVESALPLLGLLADLDRSSVAVSAETQDTEIRLIWLQFLCWLLCPCLSRYRIGWREAYFNPLSHILVIGDNPFTQVLTFITPKLCGM